MSRIWLWRPYVKPIPVVEEKNYRCCCYLFPSPSGFPIYNYVLLAIELGALALSFLSLMFTRSPSVPPQTWMNMIIWASLTILGIVASRTLRPIYMQIYLILASILFVIGFFGAGLLLVSILVIMSLPKDQYTREFERAINGGLGNRHELTGTMFLLIFCMVVILWQAQLSYSFYFYVRDRQLEIEARANRRPAELVTHTKIRTVDDKEDPEKQEMLPPPPYEP